jgi:hypothetical protein
VYLMMATIDRNMEYMQTYSVSIQGCVDRPIINMKILSLGKKKLVTMKHNGNDLHNFRRKSIIISARQYR